MHIQVNTPAPVVPAKTYDIKDLTGDQFGQLVAALGVQNNADFRFYAELAAAASKAGIKHGQYDFRFHT